MFLVLARSNRDDTYTIHLFRCFIMFRYIVYRSRNYGIYYNRLAVDTPSTYRIFSSSIVQTITELLSNLLHRLLCELLPELLSELYTNYYPHEMLLELLPLLPELLSELLLELQLDPLPTKPLIRRTI